MTENIYSEISARVFNIVVSKDDPVNSGDTLMLIESMKMEIPILAEISGTILELNVYEGDIISSGDLVAKIA